MSKGAIRHILLASSVCIASLTLPPAVAKAQAAAQTRFYAIQAGALRLTLKEFAKQSGARILFRTKDVEGLKSSGLHGSYTAGQALQVLLRDTGLAVKADASGAWAIVRSQGPSHPAKSTAAAVQEADRRPTIPLSAAERIDATAADPVESETIVVTGSRAVTNGNAAPTPLTVIGKEQLNLAAPTSVADALAQVPEFRSSARPSSFVTPQTVTGSFLNLRGLGQARVLTLLNGRRVTPTTADGRVDVNTFPDLLIRRVDIVTGGASAAYGSDAVAGVVNFVLDDRYVGVKGDIGAGVSSRGDNGSVKARAAAGAALLDDRLHLTASVDYFKSKGVLSADGREWDSKHCNVIQNPTFATDARTAFLFRCGVTGTQFATGGVIISGPLQNTQFLTGGVPATYNLGTEVTTATMIGGDGYWNARGNLSMPVETKTGFGHVVFDATPTLSLWAEGGYSTTKSSFYGTALSNNGATAFSIYQDNAFLDPVTRARLIALVPAPTPTAANGGARSFSLGRISPDWGRNEGATNTKTYRGAFGFNAKLGGSWFADGSFDLGHAAAHQENRHSPNLIRLFEAIDSVVAPSGAVVCRSALTGVTNGCAPLNPFGPFSASQAAIAYVYGDGFADNTVNQINGELTLRGSPFSTWAGEVSVAAGVSARKLTAEIVTDPLSISTVQPIANTRGYPATLINKLGVFLTGNFFNQPKHSISVKEVFTEVQLPLARDLPFAHSLDLNGAIRYADYSTTGGVTAWKVGGSWEPVEWLRLRATRSRDVRAPNLTELYQPPQAQLGPVIDPRTKVSNSTTRYFVGNPDLTTEIANTLTAGAVFKTAFIPGFSASVDYYRIKIGNAIGQLTAQQIVDLCEGGATSYCQFVVRLANGTLSSVTVAWLNQNKLVDSGIDFEANYAFTAGAFDVRLRGLVSYLDTLATTDAFGTTLEAAGVNGGELEGTPRWQSSASVTVIKGGFTGFLQARRLSGGLYSNLYVVGGRATNSIDQNHVAGRAYLDLTLKQKIAAAGNPEVYLTINNLLDKDPPPSPTRIGAPASILGTNPTLYDVIGRQFNVGLRFAF